MFGIYSFADAPSAPPIKYVPERTSSSKDLKILKTIEVETNHFPLDITKMISTAYFYDITITPTKSKKVLRNVWNVFREKFIKDIHAAYDDSKIVFSPKDIPDDKLKGKVVLDSDGGKPVEYKVDLKKAKVVNLNSLKDFIKNKNVGEMPKDVVQCLDIVLRNAPALSFLKVGRSFFAPPEQQIDLGGGVECWPGFYQSVTVTSQPTINIDVAHKGFPEAINTVDLIRKIDDRTDLNRSLENFTIRKIEEHIKGLLVQHEVPNMPHSRRKTRVNGLVQSADRFTFQDDNNVTKTVMQYYAEKYKVRLKYPHLPCLWVGSRDRASKIVHPMEFCSVVKGQIVPGKLNERQTATLIRTAAKSTVERKKKIMESIQKANFNIDPCVRAFGLSIRPTMERVTANVLAPPWLSYKDRDVLPKKGTWFSSQFLTGMVLSKWTILNLSRAREDEINSFVSLITKVSQQNGMFIEQPKRPYVRLDSRSLDRNLPDFFRKCKDMDLIFVIVPPGYVYNKIKCEAELKHGCLTQCIKEMTISKISQKNDIKIVQNVMLKVNILIEHRARLRKISVLR